MTAQMIKLLRAELGLDQQQFAHKIRYSIHTVRSWEQSIRKPSKRAVQAMRRVDNYIIKYGEVTQNGDVYAKGCISQDSIDAMRRAEG